MRKPVFVGFGPGKTQNRPARMMRPARVLKFCRDAQADLRLCCLHMKYDRFSHDVA